MKFKFLNLLLPCLVLIAFSCKKNESIDKPSEFPVKALENSSSIDRRVYHLVTEARELGFVFSANTDGKITQVGGIAYIPTTYRITIWDYDTEAILSTSNVNLDSTGYKYYNISPINILANKKYIISTNYTGKVFELLDLAFPALLFPAYSDGITIHNSTKKTGSAQAFSNCCGELDALQGGLDFAFVPK